jgi:hypothetical protein
MDKYLNVHLFKKGLSDKPHSISKRQSDNVGASHAIDGNDVKCITIDSLKLQSCDFIKMDCEGMELKALQGAEGTIYKFKPTMLLEINKGALLRQGTSAEEILAWLREHKYSYQNIYKEQGLNDAQLDIICTPQ